MMGGLVPLFLIEGSYTAEGTKGLLKEGGSKRRAALQMAVESVGGKLHAFYYAFGKWDVVAIVEYPDHASATRASLAVNSSGAVTTRTTVLITPEEVDVAVKKSVSYRPPGA
jgi:uncharacterized protein with GYD domain